MWSQDNYILSYGKGLAFYDGERVKRFSLPNEQNFASRDVIFEGFEEYVYINYGNSIHVFDPILHEVSKVIPLTKEQTQLGEFVSITATKKGGDIYTWGALRLNSKGLYSEYHLLISKNHEDFQQLTTTPIQTQGGVLIKRLGETILAKADTGFETWSIEGKTVSIPLPQVPMSVITPFNLQVEDDGTIWVAGECEAIKDRGNYLYQDRSDDQYNCDVWKKEPNTNDFIRTNGLADGRNVLSNATPYLRKVTIINGKHLPFVRLNENENIENPIRIIQNEEISLVLPYVTLKTKSGIIWWGNIDGLFKLTPQPPAFNLLPSLSLRAFVEDQEGYIYGNVDLFGKYVKGSRIKRYNPETDNVKTLLSVSYQGGYWYHANLYKNKIHAYSGIVDVNKGYTKIFEDVYKDFSDRPHLSLITKKGDLWKAHWGVPYIGIYNAI